MELDRYQLTEIISQSITAGISRHEAMREPVRDRISRREAEAYVRSLCTRNGLYLATKLTVEKSGCTILSGWIEEGRIKGMRNGAGKNSKVYFSKADIDQIVSEVKINMIINH